MFYCVHFPNFFIFLLPKILSSFFSTNFPNPPQGAVPQTPAGARSLSGSSCRLTGAPVNPTRNNLTPSPIISKIRP